MLSSRVNVFHWTRLLLICFRFLLKSKGICGQHESSTELFPTDNYVCRLFFGACLPHTDTDIYTSAHTHTPKIHVSNHNSAILSSDRLPMQTNSTAMEIRKNEYLII